VGKGASLSVPTLALRDAPLPTLHAAFKQIFNRTRKLTVKLNRRLSLNVKARQVAFFHLPNLNLIVPIGLYTNGPHSFALVRVL
jgi:hypothetical protein